MWTKIDNEGVVYINAMMVTQVRPIGPHEVEIMLACGTKHKLSMTCQEFLTGIGCGTAHEHDE